ncbi:MAG: SDR family oxidoreductase [Candidatus Eremiobacteraeota bacterium]|nr:SDR family oxidoreductase [Candidatus Eremiobacteraeota bacterium]
MSIAGKHAVVTGGGRGIGRATADLLERRGARVSVVSRSAGVRGDVTDEEQVRKAFEECREANGPIAILVNNAGIAESAALTRTDRATWDRIIAVNLTGTFLCTREALPDMIAAGWGRIVNVASVAGLEGAPYIAAYCASKHGVVGFTKAVAAEYADKGITANVVCPGYTDTEMLGRTLANITAKTGRSERETSELLARGNPAGRIAAPEEVAEAIVALAMGAQTGLALVVPHPERSA